MINKRTKSPVKKTSHGQRASGPLYLQVAADLRREIANGKLKPAQKLPALPDLARQQGVSLITVRQAVEVLESEGLLRREHGRGTFVDSGPRVGARLTLRSDWSSLLRHLEGKQPRLIKVADDIATPLIPPDYGKVTGSYHLMRRVHMSDGIPYALINIYLRKDVFDLDPEGFTNGMVITRLARLPQEFVANLRQRISFTTADPETAEHLELPVNAAVGDVLRVITDRDGCAVYVGQTKYRGDFVNLEFELSEPPR